MLNIKIIIRFFISVYTFLYLSSCSFSSFFVLSNISSDDVYFCEQDVLLTFSSSPTLESLENNLLLKCENSFVEYEIKEIDSCSFKITPKVPWKFGKAYTLQLKGSLELLDGRLYVVDFYKYFIYGKKDSNLILLESNFDKNFGEINFLFNKSINPTTFVEGFSLSPYHDVLINFSSDSKKVVISSKEGWDVNTFYRWTLKNVSSLDSYYLENIYTDIFQWKEDFVLPVLEAICPVEIYDTDKYLWLDKFNLDKNLKDQQCIGFVFSKAMDFTSLENSISFSPTISGQFYQEDKIGHKFIFVPNEKWKINEQYEIKIEKSASDLNGLCLFEDVVERFFTFNTFLDISKIVFDESNVVSIFPSKGIDVLSSSSNNKMEIVVDIYFSTFIPMNERVQTVNSISMNPFFPLSLSNVSLISTNWNDSGSILTMKWQGFVSSFDDEENFYKLNISGGINGPKNEHGEYMKEDVCVIFKYY